MYPDRQTSLRELEAAGQLNPGPWTAHSLNVAAAAEAIAAACGMDAEKAYVCGLLHDIGRREGIHGMRHIIDGYNFALSNGWDEVARICLTHSYPVPDAHKDISKRDCTDEEFAFVCDYLAKAQYDDCDRLIILCDALGDAAGFCLLEKRFVDVTRRYGVFPFTVEHWNRTIEYKEYFESVMKRTVYELLPGIEGCIDN